MSDQIYKGEREAFIPTIQGEHIIDQLIKRQKGGMEMSESRRRVSSGSYFFSHHLRQPHFYESCVGKGSGAEF